MFVVVVVVGVGYKCLLPLLKMVAGIFETWICARQREDHSLNVLLPKSL